MKTSKLKKLRINNALKVSMILLVLVLCIPSLQAQVFALENIPSVPASLKVTIGKNKSLALEIVGKKDVVLFRTNGRGNLLTQQEGSTLQLHNQSYKIIFASNQITLEELNMANIGLNSNTPAVQKLQSFKPANAQYIPAVLSNADITDLAVVVHTEGSVKKVFLAYTFEKNGMEQTNTLAFKQIGAALIFTP